MTRISRPSAPLAHGKGGTRGLDTTDLSPGACHLAMLDDYLRTHEAGPASHAIRFPRGSACRRYGTGRSSTLWICYACWMDLDLPCLHLHKTPRPQGPRLRWSTTVPTKQGRHLT